MKAFTESDVGACRARMLGQETPEGASQPYLTITESPPFVFKLSPVKRRVHEAEAESPTVAVAVAALSVSEADVAAA